MTSRSGQVGGWASVVASGPVLPAFLHPFARPTKDDFVTIVRGRRRTGAWTPSGKEYVDGMASLWYCAAGHGRTEIADAIRDPGGDARRLLDVRPLHQRARRPARRAAGRRSPRSPTARVFFTDSGSEAVDTAMKLARLTFQLGGDTDRTIIVSRDRGYHGVAYGGTSAQGIAPNREGWGPLVGDVVQVPADDVEALASLPRRARAAGRRRDRRARAGRRRRVPARGRATSRPCAGCATSTVRC